jgi:hypothetical protein
MITIPMITYIGNLASGRNKLWSFSIAKYGPQTGNDSEWCPDAGNGISTASGNPFITGNNPLDADVANSVSFEQGWVNHIISTWGLAANGGLQYYIMDNEPDLWHSTHRDVHPVGETYNEIVSDYETYAAMIRAADPNAFIVGPESWGWTGYSYSGYDEQYGAAHNWQGPFPDQSSHNNMQHIPYILQTLYSYQQSSGKQLLNAVSVHYYPQQGEYSQDDTAPTQTLRNRSTRSLWDPNYTDTSWIDSIVQLIPRMQGWVSQYYPGIQTAITEYNWGDDANLNGGTAQADILGIFGRQGLNIGSRWGTPNAATPAYLAFKIYRNYDGNLSTFGDNSVSCTVPDPDTLSAFAAQRTSDGALTVMVINKVTSSASIQLNLSSFTASGSASVYQVSTNTQTSPNKLSNVAWSNSTLSTTVPAQSITLFVLPYTATSQYDFESSTQGWASSGAPVASLSDSTAEHYTGSKSLAVKFGGNSGSATVYVASPGTPSGRVVTFHVWIPSGSPITGIQPYVQQGSGGGWLWTGNYQPIGSLHTNAWNTISVTVPNNAVTPLYQLGVQFTTNSNNWTGTCYIDDITW